MDDSKSYQVDPEVTFQRLGGETVLVHLGTGRIHHTNATGSRIWELLDSGRPVAEIRDVLLEEFEVPPDELQRELGTFLESLSAEKMIHVKDRA